MYFFKYRLLEARNNTAKIIQMEFQNVVYTIYYFNLFMYMYMCMPAWVYVHQGHTGTHRGHRALESQELGLLRGCY